MTTNPAELPQLKILLNQLDWNLQWLQQMEKNEPTEYYRDAALQRFDFTFNTAIKCIQAGALKKNMNCGSPEECFVLAERMEWMTHGAEWKNILRDYENMKSESDPIDSDLIFSNLKNHSGQFKILFDRLSELEQSS